MVGVVMDFDEFVTGRTPALLRFAYLLTHDRSLAEDVVQEALVKACRRWQRVVGADDPDAYVRRIVINEFASWRRRRSNGERPALIPDVVVPDLGDQLAERDLLWRLLGELPARQRAVLVLRYYERLPDVDIAAALGCAEGTVRSLATRAFERLRRHPGLSDHQEAMAEPREGP